MNESNLENEDIEVFLTPGECSERDASLCVLLSQAGMKTTAAQKRWKLIKNLSMSCRRFTSLNSKEKAFLVQFQEDASRSESISNDDDAELNRARRSLRQSIMKSHLTTTEASFLNSLVQSPTATVAQLEMTNTVLDHDPAFRHESKEEGFTEVFSPMKPQYDSFRSQVWTYTKAIEEENDNRETPVTVEPKDTKRDHKFHSFVYRFFTRRPANATVSDPDEDNETSLPPIVFSILGTSVEDFTRQPHVLSPPMMDSLRSYLPFVVQQDNFWIKYSLVRDGASLRCLLSKVRTSARCLIAIETMDGHVFGSFTSTPFRVNSKGPYGSGEAFVWKLSQSRLTPCTTVEDQVALESTLQVFEWTGENRNVQCLHNVDSSLMIGGGGPDSAPALPGGSALTISSSMDHGFSDPCVTFDSPSLCTDSGMFQIANLEVWTLTPVNQQDQAERLELSRQFVFDHGHFAEY